MADLRYKLSLDNSDFMAKMAASEQAAVSSSQRMSRIRYDLPAATRFPADLGGAEAAGEKAGVAYSKGIGKVLTKFSFGGTGVAFRGIGAVGSALEAAGGSASKFATILGGTALYAGAAAGIALVIGKAASLNSELNRLREEAGKPVQGFWSNWADGLSEIADKLSGVEMAGDFLSGAESPEEKARRRDTVQKRLGERAKQFIDEAKPKDADQRFTEWMQSEGGNATPEQIRQKRDLFKQQDVDKKALGEIGEAQVESANTRRKAGLDAMPLRERLAALDAELERWRQIEQAANIAQKPDALKKLSDLEKERLETTKAITEETKRASEIAGRNVQTRQETRRAGLSPDERLAELERQLAAARQKRDAAGTPPAVAPTATTTQPEPPVAGVAPSDEPTAPQRRAAAGPKPPTPSFDPLKYAEADQDVARLEKELADAKRNVGKQAADVAKDERQAAFDRLEPAEKLLILQREELALREKIAKLPDNSAAELDARRTLLEVRRQIEGMKTSVGVTFDRSSLNQFEATTRLRRRSRGFSEVPGSGADRDLTGGGGRSGIDRRRSFLLNTGFRTDDPRTLNMQRMRGARFDTSATTPGNRRTENVGTTMMPQQERLVNYSAQTARNTEKLINEIKRLAPTRQPARAG